MSSSDEESYTLAPRFVLGATAYLNLRAQFRRWRESGNAEALNALLYDAEDGELHFVHVEESK